MSYSTFCLLRVKFNVGYYRKNKFLSCILTAINTYLHQQTSSKNRKMLLVMLPENSKMQRRAEDFPVSENLKLYLYFRLLPSDDTGDVFNKMLNKCYRNESYKNLLHCFQRNYDMLK